MRHFRFLHAPVLRIVVLVERLAQGGEAAQRLLLRAHAPVVAAARTPARGEVQDGGTQSALDHLLCNVNAVGVNAPRLRFASALRHVVHVERFRIDFRTGEQSVPVAKADDPAARQPVTPVPEHFDVVPVNILHDAFLPETSAMRDLVFGFFNIPIVNSNHAFCSFLDISNINDFLFLQLTCIFLLYALRLIASPIFFHGICNIRLQSPYRAPVSFSGLQRTPPHTWRRT